MNGFLLHVKVKLFLLEITYEPVVLKTQSCDLKTGVLYLVKREIRVLLKFLQPLSVSIIIWSYYPCFVSRIISILRYTKEKIFKPNLLDIVYDTHISTSYSIPVLFKKYVVISSYM